MGVYSNANSQSAKKFLEDFIQKAPFPIKSIQVDGGSEFMKDFEQACADKDIKLFVLPPKRPQYNGGVERGNRIFREEFYSRKNNFVESLDEFRLNLQKALHQYNTFRPHFSLNLFGLYSPPLAASNKTLLGS